MLISPQNLAENLQSVRLRVAVAARASGRSEQCVTLVAVSKGQPAAAIRAIAELGHRDVGESYPQEALPKIEELRPQELCWHFIGQIQSNKTRQLAEHFHWVHGVDRLQIATRLSAQRPHYAPPLNVCVQIKLVDEPAKAGVHPSEAPALLEQIAALPRIKLRGLMCIPPETTGVTEQRHLFSQMRALREQLVAAGHELDVLSMGMSGDYEAAILEGATHVRVGTAIFGPRET